MSAADKAWRTVGFVGELTAATVAGLFELLSPRDKSGEHFAGAAASLAIKGKPSYGYDRIAREDKQHGMRRDTQPGRADPHESSHPSPVTTRTSAGDRSAAAGILPPTAAAEPLTWLGWAVPAILDVLAEHQPRERQSTGDVHCLHGDSELVCHDYGDWSEHVADLIAERIACDPARAIAALQNFQPK